MKKWLPLITIGSLILLLDQVSKAWVIGNFEVGGGMPILAPFIQITRSVNTGIAFGIGEGGSLIFLILSLFIIAVLVWLYQRSSSEALAQHIAYSLIISGALGNAVDRMQHGHVVDFVHLSLPSIVSNVSNFADHAIVVGVLLLLLDSYLQERREKALNLESATPESESALPQ